MDKSAFGARVREFRRQAKLSSDALSEICDCTPVSIRQIESGSRLPSVPKLVKICNGLQVSPNDLLGPEVPMVDDKSSHYLSDERWKEISRRVRQLSISKYNATCSVIETLLCNIEKL